VIAGIAEIFGGKDWRCAGVKLLCTLLAIKKFDFFRKSSILTRNNNLLSSIIQ
jgi:hypothetical protein